MVASISSVIWMFPSDEDSALAGVVLERFFVDFAGFSAVVELDAELDTELEASEVVGVISLDWGIVDFDTLALLGAGGTVFCSTTQSDEDSVEAFPGLGVSSMRFESFSASAFSNSAALSCASFSADLEGFREVQALHSVDVKVLMKVPKTTKKNRKNQKGKNINTKHTHTDLETNFQMKNSLWDQKKRKIIKTYKLDKTMDDCSVWTL